MPVRGVFQEKLQKVNQEITQIKIAYQSNPFTNAEPLRLHIVKADPAEIQLVQPAKKHDDFFNQAEI